MTMKPSIPGAARFAEELTDLGLMERKFADKTTVCPHCASARMTVREHCSRCGCANIVEEPIVHHLKCGGSVPRTGFQARTRIWFARNAFSS